MKFTPRNDYVLVQIDRKQEKSRGMLLPERTQDEQQEATVLAVGPGGFTANGVRVPLDLQEQDRVLVHPTFSGQQIGPKEDNVYLIRQDFITGKIDDIE